jgi:hypothetical protein
MASQPSSLSAVSCILKTKAAGSTKHCYLHTVHSILVFQATVGLILPTIRTSDFTSAVLSNKVKLDYY